jgi:hypothetical protein
MEDMIVYGDTKRIWEEPAKRLSRIRTKWSDYQRQEMQMSSKELQYLGIIINMTSKCQRIGSRH